MSDRLELDAETLSEHAYALIKKTVHASRNAARQRTWRRSCKASTDWDVIDLFFSFAESDFLVMYANVPKPEGELLEKMKAKLTEITGVGIDALQTVDNDNCPEKVEP